MSRTTTATVVAGVLLFCLVGVASVVSVPYVIYGPGPTVNLLGKSDKREIVDVGGSAKTYRDTGALRLLTVVPSGPEDHVSLVDAILAWAQPSRAVYRYRDIYQPSETADTVQEEGQVDMVSSQDAATAVAMRELGYTFASYTQVLGIQRGGPGDGALEVRDRIDSVDGKAVTTISSTVEAIQKVTPGNTVALGLTRAGKPITVKIKTVPSDANPKQSALRVTVGTGYDFPFPVKVRIPDRIGGPSAGMMFGLAIYDTLTPGSMTGGNSVAGTGTIDPEGTVGGIGGIQQKMVSAQRAGAKLFLAPAANCDEVRGGPYDPDRMRVVKVATFHDAVADIDAWRKDHDAKLPAC